MTSLTPLQKVLAATADGQQIDEGDGKWRVCCKAHADTDPSLQVTETPSGTVLLTCRTGCSFTAICYAMGLAKEELFHDFGKKKFQTPNQAAKNFKNSKKKKTQRLEGEFEAATYDYRDSTGVLIYQVVRFENPEGKKRFAQRRPDPERQGFHHYNLKGVSPVLYRLPELIAADKSHPVFIPEGEKKVDALRSWGFTATCNSGGAKKWQKGYATYFRGRDVVLLADNDPPNAVTGKSAGREHVEKVKSQLEGIAKSVRFLDLPNLPPKGDIVDWIADGGTKEQFEKLVEDLFSISNSLKRLKVPLMPLQSPPITSPAAPTIQQPIRAIDDPERLAAAFLKLHSIGDAYRHVFWCENWYRWNGRNYEIQSKNEITSELSNFTQREFDNDAAEKLAAFNANDNATGEPPVAKKNTTRVISDVMLRAKAIAGIPDKTSSPSWIHSEPEGFDSRDIVCLKNGILNLRKFVAGEPDYLIPHSPGYFNTFSLPFDFDPSIPQPMEWVRFLEDLWGNDADSIKCLQEFIGLLLTADTSYQKILLIIGPRRSGKGTIARIVEGLIGESNVAGPTLTGLATNFGLQPLIGKTVAIVPDARVSAQMDVSAVTEKLLMISGEDSITFDRKNKEGMTVVLPTRFILMTNEIPRLMDTSNALSGRLITLQMTNSFYGQEDLGLKQRLLKVLPGIFNWAVDGWKRLRENERFTIAKSSEDLMDEMEEISSPMGSFVRDRCITDPAYEIDTNKLYESWKTWCTEQGRDKPGTVNSFGIQLRAVVPGLSKRRPRAGASGADRVHVYVGIKLKPDLPGGESKNPDSQGHFGYKD